MIRLGDGFHRHSELLGDDPERIPGFDGVGVRARRGDYVRRTGDPARGPGRGEARARRGGNGHHRPGHHQLRICIEQFSEIDIKFSGNALVRVARHDGVLDRLGDGRARQFLQVFQRSLEHIEVHGNGNAVLVGDAVEVFFFSRILPENVGRPARFLEGFRVFVVVRPMGDPDRIVGGPCGRFAVGLADFFTEEESARVDHGRDARLLFDFLEEGLGVLDELFAGGGLVVVLFQVERGRQVPFFRLDNFQELSRLLCAILRGLQIVISAAQHPGRFRPRPMRREHAVHHGLLIVHAIRGADVDKPIALRADFGPIYYGVINGNINPFYERHGCLLIYGWVVYMSRVA